MSRDWKHRQPSRLPLAAAVIAWPAISDRRPASMQRAGSSGAVRRSGWAQTMFAGDRTEFGEQDTFFTGLGIPPGESGSAAGLSDIASCLPVEMSEGQDDLIGGSGKFAGKPVDLVSVERWRRQAGQKDRIVTPDCNLRAVTVPDRLDVVDSMLPPRECGFKRARITGNGVLHQKWPAIAVKPFQGCHERTDAPGPENEPVDGVAIQTNMVTSARIRIVDGALAGFETVIEPSAVKGRDVRSVARGNDHFVCPVSTDEPAKPARLLSFAECCPIPPCHALSNRIILTPPIFDTPDPCGTGIINLYRREFNDPVLAGMGEVPSGPAPCADRKRIAWPR